MWEKIYYIVASLVLIVYVLWIMYQKGKDLN